MTSTQLAKTAAPAPAVRLPRLAAAARAAEGPTAWTAHTLRRIAFLAHTHYREWRLGVRDAAVHSLVRVGRRSLPRRLRADRLPHVGSGVESRPRRIPGGVFLDYGCGQGRAPLTAATKPFRKVIGVEMSRRLCAAARANLRTARGLACRDVQVLQADAERFVTPDETTVIFLFNPFRGPMLDQVIEQIRRSVQRRPRSLTILYVPAAPRRKRLRAAGLACGEGTYH